MSDSEARVAGTPTTASAGVAAAAAASAAFRYQFTVGVTLCLVVAIVLLPVWWGALRGYRPARTVILLGALAAGFGVAVSLTDQMRDVSMSLLQGQTLNFLSFVGSIGLLIWCRSQIGASWTTTWYGFGALANIALTGVDAANAWKYTLAVPVSIALLAGVQRLRSPVLEMATLVALAVVSVLSDSRAMTAFLLLATALIGLQQILGGGRRRLRAWQVIVLFGVLAVSAFNIFQALMLDGALGEYAQHRTQEQVDVSGSLITGARPEIGASVALVGAQPWGYGSGTIPDSSDIRVAKSGMSALNYDPDNGYVERYMFGGQFEVHSVLGDLWIRFGPLGALFTLMLLGISIHAVARAFSRRDASSVMVLLLLLMAWDTFFSPVLPSYATFALLSALAVSPRSGLRDDSESDMAASWAISSRAPRPRVSRGTEGTRSGPDPLRS